ncbi:MAG TPA: response regulator [Gemmatimonadaceae bacterium]|nr:response regulator [Gemmatimonadaceae bacterium]
MSRTILLVEDNTDNRIIYRRALEHFGYTVIEALDGEEAIRLATERVPDLVLMDISIPRIDGWEATKAIRADPRTKAVPVVALTAHAMPADRARASEIGFASYLTKPIQPRKVVEEVERLTSARTAHGHGGEPERAV